VVEFSWLARAAKAPDAQSEVLDLYRSIMERSAPTPTKQTKSAGATASAHP
jgi:hypothetical protein